MKSPGGASLGLAALLVGMQNDLGSGLVIGSVIGTIIMGVVLAITSANDLAV